MVLICFSCNIWVRLFVDEGWLSEHLLGQLSRTVLQAAIHGELTGNPAMNSLDVWQELGSPRC